MRVLILGGTGSIGGAVVQALLQRGHEVLALARNDRAEDALRNAGALPVPGDIRDPGKWIDVVRQADGIIHAAAVWGEEMGEIDRALVDAILDSLKDGPSPKVFIYTGGCWLYGQTGDVVATENSRFDRIESFSWSVAIIEKVLSASYVRGMVVHPAMVYERDGGVFAHVFSDASKLGYVRVVGGENVRWPLVHRNDLAELYALMLEQGRQGDVYNGAAIHGFPIGVATRAIAQRLGIESSPTIIDIETAQMEIGSWAEGYAIDQQMSGDRARNKLGWSPRHTDVLADLS